MIHLTPDAIKERMVEKMVEHQAPRCLTVEVMADRTLVLRHPSIDVAVGGIPEFADKAVLDCVIESALIALVHQLALERATLAWNSRPDWIDSLARTPGGRVLAEKWLQEKAREIGELLARNEEEHD